MSVDVEIKRARYGHKMYSPLMLKFDGGNDHRDPCGMTLIFHHELGKIGVRDVPDAFFIDVGHGFLAFTKAAEGIYKLSGLHPAGTKEALPVISLSGFLLPPKAGHEVFPEFRSFLLEEDRQRGYGTSLTGGAV